jgi:DNA-binding transcriptional MerR regulator
LKYKISDLSKIFNLSTNAIRKYEQNGHIVPERDEENGYRWYTDEDVSRLSLIRLYVKNGFSHEEISELLNSNVEEILKKSEERLAEMDSELERLTALRHRVEDNVVLLRRVDEFRSGSIEKDAVPVYYVLYKDGESLLTEPDGLQTLHTYMYSAPETTLIYIFRKDDILNNTGVYAEGCSVKEKHVKGLNLPVNKYTVYYPSCKAVHILIEGSGNLFENVRNKIVSEKIDIKGDIMGVKIADTIENGVNKKYVLICVPI